jgi:hypothetical protein
LFAFLARLQRAATRSPLEATLVIAALAVTLYVVVAPLAASRYVPMTDLPFHVAQGAAFRHYWDPSYHFHEQFVLRPIAIPYMAINALVAAAMLVFPVLIATKVALAVLLMMVPGGLAVLFHGAKKSPLLGLLGLGMCWGHLTHWGFVNYVAALGLFSMVIGFTLLVLDRPTRGRRVGLAVALVVLFFTHIFRFPFALAGVVGTAVVMYPATRRLRPILLPMVPSLVFLGLWLAFRPDTLTGKLDLGLHLERLATEFGAAMTDGFVDGGVKERLVGYFNAAWAVAAVCAAYAVVQWRRGVRRFTAWDVGVTLVPLSCAAVFMVLFLVMPLWLGRWWYVYPREATAATIIVLGACPDLPRVAWLRVSLVAAMALAGIGVGSEVRAHYADFGPLTDDFYQITRQIPMAPRLFYMVLDKSGTRRAPASTPFIHLPAYVQAEKGGWLSWHFAIWNVLPVYYRSADDPEAVIVPRTPPRWEWTQQQQFKLSMTPFFDWFLVRKATSPDAMFAADPTIQRVDHVGWWWLYKRVPKG